MKKLIITFVIVFSTQFIKALPTLYCGQYGNLFQIYWYYDNNNNLGYTVNYIGPCSGGPWSEQPYVCSSQEAGDMTEAGSSVYSSLSTYISSPTPNGHYDNDVEDAPNQISSSDPTYWVDPNGIDEKWAKILATNQGKTIFASKLLNHPWNQTISLEIWSIQSETNIPLKLIDINTSEVIFETTVSLSEGKNTLTEIDVSGVSAGNYILSIQSSGNEITRSVTITH